MGRNTLIGIAIALVVFGILLANALFAVHEREQAIVLQFGAPQKVVTEPGLNFKLPFIQNVITIDKRILDLDIAPEQVTASDQKRLEVDAFARFRIVDPLEFYISLGNESVARQRLGTILGSGLRRVLGEESFEAVVRDKRAELMERIRDQMNSQAEQFGIEVVDVRIRRADLPEANSQAIFRRMQTEREREANEFRAQGREVAQRIRANADRGVTVTLAESTRNAEIIRGEGDACRNRIFAAAFGIDPNFFAFYRSMQSYEQALMEGETTAVLSPDSEFFRYFTDPNAIPDGNARVGRSATRASELLAQLQGDATLRSILCSELETEAPAIDIELPAELPPADVPVESAPVTQPVEGTQEAAPAE